MRRLLLLGLVISLALTAAAQKKKKEIGMPAAVLHAQFVYVVGWHGDQFAPGLPPEERSAIARVQNALEEWHRYRVVHTPEEADMMIVVKVGYIGLLRGGVGIGGIDTTPGPIGTPPPSSRTQRTPQGTFGGGEVSSVPDDMLLVSLNPQSAPDEASYIWRRSEKRGLQGKNVPLVEEFRREVTEAEQQSPKKP